MLMHWLQDEEEEETNHPLPHSRPFAIAKPHDSCSTRVWRGEIDLPFPAKNATNMTRRGLNVDTFQDRGQGSGVAGVR